MKKKLSRIIEKRGLTHTVLSAVVVLIMVSKIYRGDYFAVLLCLLTLLLFNIPLAAKRILKVTLSRELKVIILLFIFASEILGEIGSFFTHISWWDTMLHTTNGFLMAAIGFALIDVLNNAPQFHINLSPVFVVFVAFCFSMTIGVLWEFFEFGADQILHTDMQKDRIITEISSVSFDPDGLNNVVHISNITDTVLMENGEVLYVIEGGYLDVGIIDTMKDLLVNFVGAVVFSVAGYFYLIGRSKGKFVKKLIPQYTGGEQSPSAAEE